MAALILFAALLRPVIGQPHHVELVHGRRADIDFYLHKEAHKVGVNPVRRCAERFNLRIPMAA